MKKGRIFFSYSRSNSDFVQKLANDLRKANFDIWIDTSDIKPGSHWDASIESALNSSSHVLVILTPASATSNNVMDEISFALESCRTVIPILLLDCAVPFRLRRLQRVDFINNYQQGLNRLMAVLNAEEGDESLRSEKNSQVASVVEQGAEQMPSPFDTGMPVKKKTIYILIFGLLLGLVVISIWIVSNPNSYSNSEDQAWKDVLVKNDSSSFATYLVRFPIGSYSLQAQNKLDSIIKSHITISNQGVDSSSKTEAISNIGNTSQSLSKDSIFRLIKTAPTFSCFPSGTNLLGFMKYDESSGAIISAQPPGKASDGAPENVSWTLMAPKSGRYKIEILIFNPYSTDLFIKVFKDVDMNNKDLAFLTKTYISQFFVKASNGAKNYTWLSVPDAIELLEGDNSVITFHAPFVFEENRLSVRLPNFKQVRLTLVN